MAKKKMPYIPIYIGDWIQDTDCLSVEAEGAWLRIIFKCWKTEGKFTAHRNVFARVCKVDEIKFASILLEWKQNDICDIQEDADGQVTIISRRITREKEISAVRSESGSKGGSKTQAKGKANSQAKTKEKPDNDIDNDNDIDTIKYNKESLSKIELFESIFSDQRFVDDLSIAHKGKDIPTAWEECWTHHSQTPSPPTEVWQWKQKLNSWLTIKGKQHAPSKTRRERDGNELEEAFAKSVMSEFGNGQVQGGS